MKYKIGALSSLLDIAPQTIRFYEHCGVLQSSREEGNNYRNFTDMDINSLLHLKASRKFGFSVQESADLFNTCSYEEVCAFYVKREQALEIEIAFQQKVLECLSTMNREIGDYPRYMERCELAVRPAIYLIAYKKIDVEGTEEKEHNINFKLLRYFYDKVPITKATPVILQEDMRRGCDTKYLGMFFEAQDSRYLEPTCISAAKYLPEQLCIHTVTHLADEGRSFQEAMEYVFVYMEKQGLAVCGDVTASTHMGFKKATTDDIIAHFWIPVNKI